LIEARRRAMTGEQIAAEVREREGRKAQAEAEAEALKRAAAMDAAEGYAERKARRKILASKAAEISGFLQRASLAPTEDQRRKQELLALSTVATRVRITLWNEYETPSVPGTLDEAWEETKAAYARGSEITGMVIVLPEGQAFDVRNPWDPQHPGEDPRHPREE